MNTIQITRDGQAYIECLPDEERLTSEQDALDLVGACWESGIKRLMLHAENLTDDFYRLQSGLAGAVMLKLSNYGIRCALILTPQLANAGRFGEMVLETNRGNQFRVFFTRENAEDWLLSE